MARDNGPLTPDDELASPVPPAPRRRPVPDAEAGDSNLDPRLLDLEEEQEPTFLRGQKRVPVRRGSLERKTANRLKLVALGLAALAILGAIALGLYRYGATSWRFRLESSDQVEIGGNQNVSRAQVLEVVGADIGRNVFFIPLAERKKQLEEIPWVESATVMRLLPNRLKIDIRERTPVAFVQVGSKIALTDANGVVMDVPAGAAKQYSFPVIVGLGQAEPLSMRAARMKIYTQLVQELDSGGGHYSQDLSEVDLSDPEDVKVTTADPKGEVLIHLGGSDFLDRYKIFVTHLQEWRTQFEKLHSVDLRYDRQVIVNPDEGGRATPVKPTEAPKPAKRKKN